MVKFIFGIIIGAIAIIFALSNADPVAVQFLTWEFNASLAIVLLITFLIGALVALLVIFPSMWRKHGEVRKHKKALRQAQDEHQQIAQEKEEVQQEKQDLQKAKTEKEIELAELKREQTDKT